MLLWSGIQFFFHYPSPWAVDQYQTLRTFDMTIWDDLAQKLNNNYVTLKAIMGYFYLIILFLLLFTTYYER